MAVGTVRFCCLWLRGSHLLKPASGVLEELDSPGGKTEAIHLPWSSCLRIQDGQSREDVSPAIDFIKPSFKSFRAYGWACEEAGASDAVPSCWRVEDHGGLQRVSVGSKQATWNREEASPLVP
ncbi:stress-associated endoplasmic reticulum protein 2 isoform X2 [Sciurus carolinensis]|uniref:stress-associated endoplasmic reticulum protein 2 isoform X2 n=1 Tax=Sciurus carolinensis TaxID=30640 RepID=UPI001FB2BE94|nr:stress-associated endoplasmic reticulum protein 2 isoform X2 [Sciurus carolinensis]